MKVSFRFDDDRAQLILIPANPIDEMNLATLKQFGDRNVKFKQVGNEFVVDSNLLKIEVSDLYDKDRAPHPQ